MTTTRIWYVLPGKDAETETLRVEWKNLYESKKTTDGNYAQKTQAIT
jgi:hypothetical protein